MIRLAQTINWSSSKSALLFLMVLLTSLTMDLVLSAPAHAVAHPRIKPPAPGPRYLSPSDYSHLSALASAAKQKQFATAQANLRNIQDPLAKSVGQWLYYRADDPAVNLVDAGIFLDGHTSWPHITRIQRTIEKRITTKTPNTQVLAFFNQRTPETGMGKMHMARALLASGEKERAEALIRDAWINNNFTQTQEKRLLNAYSKRLTKEDHAARVDRLLWGRQVTNARRVFSQLDSKTRKMAQTRASLLLGASSGASAYRKLPQEQQLDSGLLHAAVRYYRRRGENEYAISLAEKSPQFPDQLRNTKRWWAERQLLMRWALKQGRFNLAYKAASYHGLAPGTEFAEAEFNAGWIALRFLNDPERAKTHFWALASAVKTPISISRAYYWLGRAAKATGRDAEATTHFAQAAEYYYSYYGQLAAEELGGNALEKRFSEKETSTLEEQALFSARPTVKALRMISDLDLDFELMIFAYHIDDQLQLPGEYIELAKITNGEGAPHLTVRAGKVSLQKDAFAANVAYPLVYVPDEASRFVKPEIILGLSRQESEFNSRAFSRAGARGMMQLIPSTAQITAQKEGLRYSRSALLDDPVYNMTVGSAHLSHLLERFDGSLIMTFAAYNAGARRSDQWALTYGDPRSPSVDPVDWVELIPFRETRNYVQRVLENMQVYRGRLNNSPIPGKLSADLERGGKKKRAAKLGHPSPTLANLGKLNHQSGNLAPIPQITLKRAAAFINSGAQPRQYNWQKTDILKSVPTDFENTDTFALPAQTSTEHANTSHKNKATTAGSGKTKNLPTADTFAERFARRVRGESTPATSVKDNQTNNAAPEAPPTNVEADATEDKEKTDLLDTLEFILDTETKAHSASPVPPAQEVQTQTPAAIEINHAPPHQAIEANPPTLSEKTVSASEEECISYRAFLAQSAKDEAQASDLNDGMLAELRGGGGDACR